MGFRRNLRTIAPAVAGTSFFDAEPAYLAVREYRLRFHRPERRLKSVNLRVRDYTGSETAFPGEYLNLIQAEAIRIVQLRDASEGRCGSAQPQQRDGPYSAANPGRRTPRYRSGAATDFPGY